MTWLGTAYIAVCVFAATGTRHLLGQRYGFNWKTTSASFAVGVTVVLLGHFVLNAVR